MTKNEADRRVQRTRRLLQEACIDLVLEKGYSKVTVQDVLDRADIGRSTFYAHFRDKDDLLASRFDSLHAAFEEHLKLVLDNLGSEGTSQTNLLFTFLKYVEHENRLVKALFGKKSGGVRTNFMQNYLVKYIRNLLPKFAKAKLANYQLDAVAEHTGNALLTLTVWWVDNDMPCSVEEVYRLMVRLLEPGLIEVLEVPSVWPSLAETPER